MVLVRLRSDLPTSEAAAIFRSLADLRDYVSGMLSFSHGPNVSPEGLDRGFTHAFTADFSDVAARDRYLAAPEHKAAGERLVQATEGGIDGLTVIDFEVSAR